MACLVVLGYVCKKKCVSFATIFATTVGKTLGVQCTPQNVLLFSLQDCRKSWTCLKHVSG